MTIFRVTKCENWLIQEKVIIVVSWITFKQSILERVALGSRKEKFNKIKKITLMLIKRSKSQLKDQKS